MQDKPIVLACSIFKHELELLTNDEDLNFSTQYMSSMLHMDPEQLDNKILENKNNLLSNNKNIVLLYGDCCPNMNTYGKEPGISRTIGINCIEIFLGKEHYRKLRKEGAFFLMPEWTLRWKEVFKYELKLEGEVAREFMNEFHTKIIYLDTEQIEIPSDILNEIKKYTGLPVEILKANTLELKKSLDIALRELQINRK